MFLTLASRKSQLGIHFQEDPANLIRERERTLGIKAARGKYHLPVMEEEMMIEAVVMKNQIKESHGILKLVKKSLCLKVTICTIRLQIGKE